MLLGMLLAGSVAGHAMSQEPENHAATTPVDEPATSLSTPILTMDMVNVIGSVENEMRLPGSGVYLPAEKAIEQQSYTNINDVLIQVPGVYVREEDGYGNFPNISLRGVDSGRSAKVTIMEDGILSVPAPYSAPAAYYSPNIGRMSAVEVLKGSSQIAYGPQTTGGVINMISTEVPQEFKLRLKSYYGSYNEVMTHFYVGDTQQTSIGNVGWLLELWYHRTDGYREIDERPGFNSGDDTGFQRIEPMVKLFWEPDSTTYQRLELKFGYTNFEADESYLGLTDRDLRSNPYRRYAATRYDNMDTYQYRTYLRYIIEPTEDLRFTATGYYNRFHRNWYKLRNGATADGTSFSLSEALAAGGEALEVLKGNSAGSLGYRANNRDYDAAGFDLRVDWDFETGSVEHEVDFGARFHWDRVDRFQHDTTYFQDSSGRFTHSTKGPRGGGGNRVEETYALALYVQDRIQIGKLAVIPGVRYEHLEQEYRDYNTTGSPSKLEGSGTASTDVFAPGIGLNYEITPELVAFGGVYRGFSTPEPRARAKDNVDVETSIGYEAGLRHSSKGFRAEGTLFYTAFQDLLVIDNIGASGSGSSENVGDVDSYGIELAVHWDPGVQRDWAFNLPLRAGFTYTRAELDGDASSSDPESIFSGGLDGNQVPYIPEYLLTAGVGVEYGKFGLYLDANYVPEMFATASNTTSQLDPTGDPDARYGKTDSYFLMDLSAEYNITDQVRVFAGIRNLFDKEYISSRSPEGSRSGAPRMFYGGVELVF